METMTEEEQELGEVDSPYKDWLTIGEVSRRLNVSNQRTQAFITTGKLPFIRTHLGRLFDPNGLSVLIDHRRSQGHQD